MKRVKVIIIVILSILTLGYILSFFVEFRFGRAKFEKSHQIRISNGSIHNTLANFVSNEDMQRINGKTVFFNSWATWCGHCIKEIPILNYIENKFQNDTNVIFVSYCSDVAVDKIDSILDYEEIPKLNYFKLTSKQGLRMSLRKLSMELNPSINVDTSVDSAPLNIIFNSQGKLLYYKHSLSLSDTTEIFSILNKEN